MQPSPPPDQKPPTTSSAGTPPPARSSQDAAIAAEILRQTAASGPGASISPSDVAAALHVEWRSLLGRVRRVAIELAREGRIDILRKGRPVVLDTPLDAGAEPDTVKGVIRLRLRADSASQDTSPDDTAPQTD